jgi:hypothetical protein
LHTFEEYHASQDPGEDQSACSIVITAGLPDIDRTALVDDLRNELASFPGPNREQEVDVTLVVFYRSS